VGYGLGVDLGTSFTAVAIGRHARARIVPLGDDPISASTLTTVRPPGSLLVREIDDSVPVVLGGRPYPAVAVLAEALRSALATVTASEGEAPEQVVLTCPAVWGPSRRQQFGEVSRRAGLTSVTVVSEPEAAVTGLVDGRRLVEDDVVVVYDIGGVTVDMTVIRVTDSGMEILGLPEGADGAGGADFDDLILAHVDRMVGGALSELDLGDPSAVGVLTGVRAECVRAKEALSEDEVATVRLRGLAEVVGLGEEMAAIQLARSDFEAMIRTPLTSTLAGLRRVLDSAGVQPTDLTAVVLVGGSSRIPLVSRMLAKSLGRPILADDYPQHCVALGAAAIAGGTTTVTEGARRITPGAPPVTNSIPTVAAANAMIAAAKSAESRAAAKPLSGWTARGRATKAAARKSDSGDNDPARAGGPATTPATVPTVYAPPVPRMTSGSGTSLVGSAPVVTGSAGSTTSGACPPAGAVGTEPGPELPRRAGGHRSPGLGEWRRWFGAERYSVAERRWRIGVATGVTVLLIGGAGYALVPSGADAANDQALDVPYAPDGPTLPALTVRPTTPSATGSASARPSATKTTAPTATARPTTTRPKPPATTAPPRMSSTLRPIRPTTAAPITGPITGTGPVVGLGGKCLDVLNGWDRDGTPVQIFECNGLSAQTWTATGDQALRALGKCLEVADRRSDESRLVIDDCSGRGRQQWVVSSGNIVNPRSGKCLGVAGNNPNDRTPVLLTECSGAPGQRWTLQN
jgi:actin-like ATPase involved in cell morphogenesis